MKIQLLSDLHFEFMKDGGQKFVENLDPAGVDVLLLAGDILPVTSTLRARLTLEAICKRYPHVVYVPGNHEYYGSRPIDVDTSLVLLCRGKDAIPNLEVLYPGDTWEHEGKRFLGGTLWFADDRNNRHYKDLLNDFSLIPGLEPWCYEQSDSLADFLRQDLRKGDIVVTHHLPSMMSVPDEFRLSSTNRFFVRELGELIREREPALWVHGHTHKSCDYMLGATRVACNPRGYYEENKSGFNPKLVLEVP